MISEEAPRLPSQEGAEAPRRRPPPPIAPYNPKLDWLREKGGPKDVPLPDWLKK